jgi:hypothetical protein
MKVIVKTPKATPKATPKWIQNKLQNNQSEHNNAQLKKNEKHIYTK